MGQVVTTVHTLMTTCAAASCGPRPVSPLYGISPDVWAAVSGAAAVVQVLAAGMSLYAAMRIARRQERRADMADERAGRAVADERARVAAEEIARVDRFLAAVRGVGSSATLACEKAVSVIRPEDGGSVWSSSSLNWNREMREAASALEALRPVAPPDASLALILARLQAALTARDLASEIYMFQGVHALTAIKAHQGSISLALNALDGWSKPPITLADVVAVAAPEVTP